MELETILDVTLKGYDKYQTFIEKLYPGQPLYLELSVNSNGYDEILVKSNLGIIGELFSEDGEELLPYLKDPDKFYIKTSLKKHYIKESIKLAVVVIIEVFRKDKDFVAPVPVFLGDYITNYDKYKVGAIKIGELNKENSSKIINYLRNEDYSVEARIKKVSESRCTIDIIIQRKFYVMKTNYLKDKSLLIEGVEVIGDDGKSLLEYEKELILSDGYTLEEDIRIREENEKKWIERRKKKEEQDKKLAPFSSAGCLSGLIGGIGLLIYFFDTENSNPTLYISIILIFISIILFFYIQKEIDKNKSNRKLTKK